MVLETRQQGSRLWWAVGLLIAVPAVILAVVGLRSVRLDRLEWEQQIGERELQVVRLADLEWDNALGALEAGLESPSGAHANDDGLYRALGHRFSTDLDGTVIFPREGIVFTDDTNVELDRQERLPPAALRAVARTQAAEAQGRGDEVSHLAAAIAASTPALADWARWTGARMDYERGAGSHHALADPVWSRANGRTPGGLPVALIAAAFAGQVPTGQQAVFRSLVRDTLDALQAGTWLLSLSERRFYDAELGRVLRAIGEDRPVTSDDELEELATLAPVIRRVAPGRGALRRTAERSDGRTILLLWSDTEASGSTARVGLALSERDIRVIADRVFGPLVATASFGVAVRDDAGGMLWPAGTGIGAGDSRHGLRSVPGWDLAVSRPAMPAALSRGRVIWFSFIAMLIVMLGTGLVMAARGRRHEGMLARRQADFVAAVSHEFKSPLTSIRLHMERLSDGRTGPAETADYYAAIGQETARLERLVNRLLDSQQLQEGRKRYAFGAASIADAAGAAVARLRPQAEAKGVRLDFAGKVDGEEARFDREAITNAIENLIENAVKYSRAGSIVSVSAEADRETVRAHVCDAGIGIDARDLPRIFDKFYRGRRGDATDVRGTGLGLSLVKAIVEGHGGTVAVASTPGEGSRFSLTLPRRPAAGESA